MKINSILSIYIGLLLVLSALPLVASNDNSTDIPILKTPKTKIITISYSYYTNNNLQGKYDFDVLTVNNQKVTVLFLENQIQQLIDENIPYEIIYDSLEEMYGWTANPLLLRQFHDYNQLTSELQNIAATYPSISKLYDIGTSVQGRTIWGLKVSDNPQIEEDEPEVRMCGLHHGDELMSVELNLNLAWLLVNDYGSDPDITDLVDNREIWIIPMVNPDGRMASPYPTRYNANGVDLNRDYGYMWAGSGSSPSPYSQPETQVIREHAIEHNFVLSLSFHTTASYVNYLWNYKPQPSPDDYMVQQMSYHYAGLSGYTAIRGYDWYQTRGDTNDFSYGCRGDIDWTIETGNSDIIYSWNKNRQAMLDIIEQADVGVRGIVTDATSGQPITATVWVEEAYWPVFTDPDVGDYHHVLPPGTYTLHFQANGYAEKIETVTVSSADDPAVLNAALNPSNDFHAYQVTTCEYYAPSGNFGNNPTDGIHALGIPDEYCSSLGKGGEIVLDLGEDSPVFDLPGEDDFVVIEGDDSDDGYSVYLSENWDGPWTNVGTGMGTTSFDIAGYGITSAQFIKIVDDNDGSASEYKPGADIDAIQNLAAANANKSPLVPNPPTGPDQGVTGIESVFTAITTDPEGDDISYKFDWGDGTTSEWIGPVNSGISVDTGHIWQEAGLFEVRVKASDSNSESAWSMPTSIEIAQGPILSVKPMGSGLFRLQATIANDGAVDAEDVDWRIQFDGGAIIGASSEGTGLTVPAGDQATISSGLVLGLGPTVVTTTVEYGAGGINERTQNGVILFFFINIRPSGG
jgi:hypothetical protein